MSSTDNDARSEKSADAFRTITEVADQLDVQQHVLRFWETKFTQIKPMKRAGGRRYYRPDDVRLLDAIRVLLHEEGYTIRGVQKILRESGVKAVLDGAANATTPAPSGGDEASPADSTPETEAAEAALPGLLDTPGAASEPVVSDASTDGGGAAVLTEEESVSANRYHASLIALRQELRDIRALFPEVNEDTNAPSPAADD